MNQVLYKLWLWFWHLLPANPILVRVVQVASRRSRHLWLRIGYLGTLLLVVVFSLALSSSGRSASLADLAKGASQTFSFASLAQLAMMCFLAPAFTAAAITQEKDAQTFNILISTPLSSGQIVFGSLMSRLYFVIVLLIAGLPIFLMTMVYGGVTTAQVIESFALSASTAVLTGSVAIFIAMMGVGTRRTIFSFYLVIAFYLVAIYLVGHYWDRSWIDSSPANLSARKMSWLTPLHPFLALQVALDRIHAPPYERLVEHGGMIRFALAYPSAAYVTWTSLASLCLTLSSIFFVRRGVKTGEPTWVGTWLDRFRKQQSGQRSRPPRTVWNNPVAWREATGRASGGGVLRLAIIAIGFAGPLTLAIYYWNGGMSITTFPQWLSALVLVQFALALIIATNTAATSMTKEKESQTMDLLLTTPLTSNYILWGKLRGLVSFALPLLAGPVIVLLLIGFLGPSRANQLPAIWTESAVELFALVVVFTAAACVLGLHVSLRAKKTVMAVMYSVGLVVVVTGVLSLMGTAFVKSSGGEFGAFIAPFTPFTCVRYLVDPRGLFATEKDFTQGASAARVAAAFGCACAFSLYLFVVWRAYSGLVRNFDMTLRKQSGL